MIGRLKQLLVLPPLDDEEARKARLVKYSLVLACGMNATFLLSILILLPGQTNLVMIALAITVVLGVNWWLLKKGHIQLVSWLLVASAGTLTTGALFTLGPGYSSNYGSYLIIALFTGLMIGPRWVPVITGIGLVSWMVGLFIFESGWITPPPPPVNTTYRTFADALTFVFSSALIYWFTRSIQQSLIQARNTAAARQQAVEELHRTTVDRSYLENILQSMAEMLLVLDMKGQIVTTNQALLDRLGYKESELIGQPSTIVIAPDTTGRTATDSMIGIGFTRRVEQIYLTKNGIPIPVSFSGRMLRSEDGRIQGVVCVAQDITEQKHSRQIAAESQTRFRIVAEASEAAIVLMKAGGTLLYANAAAERISGYSVDEMRTMNLSQLFLKEDRAANEAKFKHLLIDDTTPIQIETRIISRNKQEKWLYCSATTTYLNAEPTLIVTALDITEKKQAESRLIQSEALKSAILAASLDAFILTDQSGNILEFNPAAEQLFGYNRAEILGRNMIQLLVAESHPAYYAELASVFQDNLTDQILSQRYEITGQHQNGTHIPIELTVFPVQTEAKVTFAAYLRDISDQIRARKNERLANAEKERVKVLTEFVRDSSHDFRTPLSTINTSLYLLQRAEDDLKRSEHATAITRQTARLEKLIEGMLMMVRLDSDVEFEYQWIDLNGLVRDVSVRIRSLAARKDQQMKLNLATDVPHIHAAGHELGRALVEILENAVIFTPRGGEISLETAVRDDQIQIEIRDTGIGISEADLPYIFNRFYRVDKARSTETGGVGLGLPIAQKIIQQHGGRIEVESIPGEGSTFRVILPVQPD